MSLEQKRGGCLPLAALFNAVFLLAAALSLRVGFESNDDLTLAAFVDGQMSVMTAHIPYLNIVLAGLLKGIYTLLGQGVPWHTLGQYLLLFAGFTALCHVLCLRLGMAYGLGVGAVLLLFFGTDAYTIISYTKTAAVCTVGGMLLLLQSGEPAPAGAGRTARAAGIVLCVFGFMLRPMEFLPCFGILGALCLRRLCGLLWEKGPVPERFGRLLRYALPFASVLLLALLLQLVNEAAWSGERWAPYHSYDRIRVAYSDYGRPAYEEMPEVYDALGLSETDVRLLEEGNYFDPEVFSGERMQAIAAARDAAFPPPSFGECLGLLLDKCLPGFFVNLPVYGLRRAAGGRRGEDWLGLVLAAGLFALAYLYLIRRGRYLIDRVDLGLLLALASVPAYLLEREKLRRERLLGLLTLLLAFGLSAYLLRGSLRARGGEDLSAARAAVERLLEDEEHVYLAKLDTVNDRIYSPFETAGRGYWDRIVLLGGFDCNHPVILDNLARYGVQNPYRDCVGNDRVYLIEDDVELTLAHIREHYNARARAELVEPISRETGLRVYRILG